MGDFFKAWRRKAGVATLVIALLFIVEWIKSWSHFECINVPIGKYSMATVASSNHMLGLSH